MNPETIMTRARTRLLLDSPWFGALAMRLRMESDPSIPTIGTDGTKLAYNPQFVSSLPDAHLTAVMAHEVMHCALLHPFRRGSRDFADWNKATDYAINNELVAAGFQLPPDVLIDPQYAGQSAEAIYASLQGKPKPDPQGQQNTPQPDPQGQGGGGQGQPDPQGPLSTGTCEDAPQGQPGQQPDSVPAPVAPGPMTAEDWKIATEQATAVARAVGTLPGGAVRSAKSARQSAEDWRATLREFIEHTQPSDYTWGTCNRHHIADGLYLPGILRENLGRLGVVVDTSGSIDQPLLDCFARELTAIAHEARPESIDVVYCDSRVRHSETFSPDDAEISLNAKGGGGTRFQPAFDHFNALDTPPVAVIYFTDLECSDHPTEPDYPVLWVTGIDSTPADMPFGRTVRMDLYADSKGEREDTK